MKVARQKRDPAAAAGEPFEYDLVDYLVSIASRVKPLKSFGVDMLNAGIRAFRALWPGEEAPADIPNLAKRLLETESQLSDWRESAARIGADEALSFVLSWYDGINLDVLQSMRAGSPISRTRSWWRSAGSGPTPSSSMPTCIRLWRAQPLKLTPR